MIVNGNIEIFDKSDYSTYGGLLHNSRAVFSFLQDHYRFSLNLIRGFVGGGYIKALSNSSNAVTVGGGLSYNGYHNFLLHASTNQQVGISYYYNFQKKKKK